METSEIEKASMDDIVFEGRNKAYGAYLLRKLYNRHLAIATALAISLFALFLSAPLIANLSGNEIILEIPPKPSARTHTLTEIVLPPKPEPAPALPAGPAEPVKPRAQAATQRLTQYQIQPDARVTQPLETPDAEALKGVEIGLTTQPGDPDGLPSYIEDFGSGPGVGAGTGNGMGAGQEAFLHVEQMPEFNGSMAAFLQKHIRYPQEAARQGLEGLVVLTFTVSPTGEISDIVVVKSLGAALDEEAIRVTKLMPPWRPGKQNGQAVPVRFTLPFRFAIK